MKGKYIFFTPTISGIGGSQIYVLNKIHYLRRLGYDCFLLHANINNKNILIEEIKTYQYYGIESLKFPIFYYNERVQKDVLVIISDWIHYRENENLFIESHNLICATWGEFLAQKLHGKHIVFLLSEYPQLPNKGWKSFMDFKYDRHELAGISKDSICRLFKSHEYECRQLSAYCSNVYGTNNNVKIPIFNGKYDYTIGSIGRLDKQFLLTAIYDIVDFSMQYPDKKIALVLIGGGSKSRVSKIKNVIKKTPIDLFITGDIYPIPITLLLIPDVYVSVAGSCRVSSRLGKLTISYDVVDCSPIGIVDITTVHSTYRGVEEKPISLSELLRQILIDRKYKESISPIDINKENSIDFSSHFHFLQKSSCLRQYYPVCKIKKTSRDKILMLLNKIFGTPLLFSLKTKFF